MQQPGVCIESDSESLNYIDQNISITEDFQLLLRTNYAGEQSEQANILVSNCNVTCQGNLIEISSQFTDNSILNKVPSHSNIVLENSIFYCPDSSMLIKTNSGEITVKNCQITCKNILIESTMFGSLTIDGGSTLNIAQSIDLLCGGGNIQVSDNVVISTKRMFCYNLPYSPLIKGEDLLVSFQHQQQDISPSISFLGNSFIDISGNFLVIGSKLTSKNSVICSAGQTMFEVQDSILLEGTIECDCIKFASNTCTIDGELNSRSNISIIHCKQFKLTENSKIHGNILSTTPSLYGIIGQHSIDLSHRVSYTRHRSPSTYKLMNYCDSNCKFNIRIDSLAVVNDIKPISQNCIQTISFWNDIIDKSIRKGREFIEISIGKSIMYENLTEKKSLALEINPPFKFYEDRSEILIGNYLNKTWKETLAEESVICGSNRIESTFEFISRNSPSLFNNAMQILDYLHNNTNHPTCLTSKALNFTNINQESNTNHESNNEKGLEIIYLQLAS